MARINVEQFLVLNKNNPKRLFQIDGFGAIFSAIMTGIVLVEFEHFFGIPKSTLCFLALFPCLFAVYDFYCYFKINKQSGDFLKRIAIMNLVYSCLSVGFAIYHKEEVTNFGWIYILMEVMVLCGLSFIELKVAKLLTS